MLKQPFAKTVSKLALRTLSTEEIAEQETPNIDVGNEPNPASKSEEAIVRQKDVEGANAIATETSDRKVDKAGASEKKTAKAKLLKPIREWSVGKAAIVLGALGAATGLAFTRVSTDSIQPASLIPERARPQMPLSRAGDPTFENFVESKDLFLTHQIFYRKVEALTGAPVLPQSVSPPRIAAAQTAIASPTSPKASSTNASTKAKNSSKTGNNAKKSSSAATPSTKLETEAEQAERVIAAAPPAPKAEPASFSGTTIDSVLEMRVAVAKDVPAIGFATSDGGAVTDLNGNPIKELAAQTAFTASINGGLSIDGETLPGGSYWIYPDNGGFVAIGDRWYRGRVLLTLRERGLLAVNYVLLGDYLYSVVGTEVAPTWPAESLKAQAVAARSYALTHNIHPASETHFDLDNTQRFQAYHGIGKEANTTQAAVQATAGEFISYDGGIVESLYAASQAIVDDAHKGSGMSQLGAKDLAEQGYSYEEILGHYYPGTALGRLETDKE